MKTGSYAVTPANRHVGHLVTLGVMSAAEAVLAKMLDILESGWCKGAFARASDGRSVLLTDDQACSWCVLGALARSTDALSLSVPRANVIGLVRYVISREIAKVEGVPMRRWIGKTLSDWNDRVGQTKSHVLDVLRKALASFRLELGTLRTA